MPQQPQSEGWLDLLRRAFGPSDAEVASAQGILKPQPLEAKLPPGVFIPPNAGIAPVGEKIPGRIDSFLKSLLDKGTISMPAGVRLEPNRPTLEELAQGAYATTGEDLQRRFAEMPVNLGPLTPKLSEKYLQHAFDDPRLSQFLFGSTEKAQKYIDEHAAYLFDEYAKAMHDLGGTTADPMKVIARTRERISMLKSSSLDPTQMAIDLAPVTKEDRPLEEAVTAFGGRMATPTEDVMAGMRSKENILEQHFGVNIKALREAMAPHGVKVADEAPPQEVIRTFVENFHPNPKVRQLSKQLIEAREGGMSGAARGQGIPRLNKDVADNPSLKEFRKDPEAWFKKSYSEASDFFAKGAVVDESTVGSFRGALRKQPFNAIEDAVKAVVPPEHQPGVLNYFTNYQAAGDIERIYQTPKSVLHKYTSPVYNKVMKLREIDPVPDPGEVVLTNIPKEPSPHDVVGRSVWRQKERLGESAWPEGVTPTMPKPKPTPVSPLEALFKKFLGED